jgi:class 3 adenylate cyclase/tetratricopeptide (TPR) repeat protein
MECRACGADNREGRRFCARCGGPLAVPCPDCGFANDAADRFCGGCGKPVHGPAAALGPDEQSGERPTTAAEAERRQLTVMFCDLVGSTQLSARLDPEEARLLIHGFQKTCADLITRYDGYVARYMGDGVLAYFGYPRAHEDDVERAVRAALDLIGALAREYEAGEARGDTRLAARIGIATGLVVVGDLLGKGAAEERTAVGDPPNLAARLQGLAEPNSVVIAPATRRLLGQRFICEDLGEREIKGFAKPVAIARVVGPADRPTRFAALRSAGLTPFVGRDHEIAAILDRWREATGGDGQVVLITGEAGLGKSRIALTVQERIAGDNPTVLQLQCSPFHRNSALHPIVEQLRLLAGIGRDDDDAGKLAKLQALLTRISPGLGDRLALFAELLSIAPGERLSSQALSPERQREETLAAILALVAALAEQRPLLAVVEDVHWIDATTRQALDLVIDRAPALRLLVLITYRPDFAADWAGQPHVTLLSLNRMDRRLSARLIDRLLAGRALPAPLLDQIVERTDGIPLFVEELTKTVVESGLITERADHYELTGPLSPLGIPATLQDSLMARIDQLESVKDIAQIGAAIGREFPHELVAAVYRGSAADLGAGLDRLTRSGLVFQRGEPPRATYTFKHALVRNAAYESLLKSRRQQLHAQIAAVLEERFPETVAAEPEILAQHCTEAGFANRAVGYWRAAGERAESRAANSEAISHFAKGVEVAATLADAERAAAEVELRLKLATTLRVVERYDEALAHLDRAEAAAGGCGLASALSRIHHCRGNVYFVTGNLEGCRRQHGLALVHAQRSGIARDEAQALGGLGDAAYLCGRMRTACEHFRRCVEVARGQGFADIEAANLHMVGWSRIYLLEFREALADGLTTAALAQAHSLHRAEMLGRTLAAFVLPELGDLAGARAHAEASLELTRKLGSRSFESESLAFLIRILLLEGRPDEAKDVAEQAKALVRRFRVDKFFGPVVFGLAALATDDRAERERIWAEAEAMLAAGCISHNYFWFYRDAIEAALQAGDWAAAQRFCQALADYGRDEPLPLSDFYVARGRALAAIGDGRADGRVYAALQRLALDARRSGPATALPAIERALAGG